MRTESRTAMKLRDIREYLVVEFSTCLINAGHPLRRRSPLLRALRRRPLLLLSVVHCSVVIGQTRTYLLLPALVQPAITGRLLLLPLPLHLSIGGTLPLIPAVAAAGPRLVPRRQSRRPPVPRRA